MKLKPVQSHQTLLPPPSPPFAPPTNCRMKGLDHARLCWAIVWTADPSFLTWQEGSGVKCSWASAHITRTSLHTFCLVSHCVFVGHVYMLVMAPYISIGLNPVSRTHAGCGLKTRFIPQIMLTLHYATYKPPYCHTGFPSGS